MKLLSIVLTMAVVATYADQRHVYKRDLRYRQNVGYAFSAVHGAQGHSHQQRVEQIDNVKRVPVLVVPVTAVSPLPQNHLLLLQQVRRPVEPVLHFPTRKPLQALDRLHTRVDASQLRRPAHTVAHSHSAVYHRHHQGQPLH